MITNLEELISNSRTLVIENSPHRVMVENDIKVNKIIDEFIKK